jgi:pSer/pThr/pTyr-binding forkhead associated (FHA) protein
VTDSAGPTSVRLKYRGADVFLSEGVYLIGRSATCSVVLDDSRASRRHARIAVSSGQVTIEDLGSVNGVFVNGLRIPPGPRKLADGDRIAIGGAELELRLGGAPSLHRERNTIETPMVSASPMSSRPPAARPIQPFDSEPPVSNAGTGTQKADVFELVGPIAHKVLAQGRPGEAENILNAHLAKVLDDYRKNRPVAPPVTNAALTLALDLAAALGSTKWLNYAFDVLTHARVLLDAPLGQKLLQTMARVDTLDPARVSEYVRVLRELPQSYEKVRALHQAEELLQAASRKR